MSTLSLTGKKEQKKWNWTDEFQALSDIFAEEGIQHKFLSIEEQPTAWHS